MGETGLWLTECRVFDGWRGTGVSDVLRVRHEFGKEQLDRTVTETERNVDKAVVKKRKSKI